MDGSFTKKLITLDQSCLIISDLHFPYSHPDSLFFLEEIKTKFKPQLIFNSGDEVDGHSISFHDSDSALPNADQELELSIEKIHQLRDMFPSMYLCESNHGSLRYRKLKHGGIPLRHLKSLPDLYGTPGWSWHHEIQLETHLGFTLMTHGKSGAYNKLASVQGCNAIQGHHHNKFEITWAASSTGCRFNMIVGCLIDVESRAFAYGKDFPHKPMLGVGWINELGEPALIRMILDKHGRWIGKL